MSTSQQAQEIKKQKLLNLLTIANDQTSALVNLLRHIKEESEARPYLSSSKNLSDALEQCHLIEKKLHDFRYHSLPVLIDEDPLNIEPSIYNQD